MEPASLTKIMTVYVVAAEIASGNIKLDDQVLVSETAWRMEGSRMFIEVGKRISVHDLLLAKQRPDLESANNNETFSYKNRWINSGKKRDSTAFKTTEATSSSLGNGSRPT